LQEEVLRREREDNTPTSNPPDSDEDMEDQTLTTIKFHVNNNTANDILYYDGNRKQFMVTKKIKNVDGSFSTTIKGESRYLHPFVTLHGLGIHLTEYCLALPKNSKIMQLFTKIVNGSINDKKNTRMRLLGSIKSNGSIHIGIKPFRVTCDAKMPRNKKDTINNTFDQVFNYIEVDYGERTENSSDDDDDDNQNTNAVAAKKLRSTADDNDDDSRHDDEEFDTAADIMSEEGDKATISKTAKRNNGELCRVLGIVELSDKSDTYILLVVARMVKSCKKELFQPTDENINMVQYLMCQKGIEIDVIETDSFIQPSYVTPRVSQSFPPNYHEKYTDYVTARKGPRPCENWRYSHVPIHKIHNFDLAAMEPPPPAGPTNSFRRVEFGTSSSSSSSSNIILHTGKDSLNLSRNEIESINRAHVDDADENNSDRSADSSILDDNNFDYYAASDA